jgi:hypothetical protein
MPPGRRRAPARRLRGQRLALAGEHSRAARLTWSRQPRGRPAGLPDRPRANRPRGSRALFPLFYLVEIRHRQLLQTAISHQLTA